MKLKRKGYARIYTDTEENVEKIKEIIKMIDAEEYDYMPKNLVGVWDGEVRFVYNGKFYEIDMDDVMQKCWNAGIHCFYTLDSEKEVL